MTTRINVPCHLIPKDPTKRGRAVLARGCHDHDKNLDFFIVYTDFGNISKLTYQELIEIYEIGEPVKLQEWVIENTARTNEMCKDFMDYIS